MKSNKAQTSTAFLFLILANLSIVCPVNSRRPDDIAPPPNVQWLTYVVAVVISETIAGLVGAELLWRLTNKTVRHKQEKASRSDVYKNMLLVMILSFSVGLLFWKMFGLI